MRERRDPKENQSRDIKNLELHYYVIYLYISSVNILFLLIMATEKNGQPTKNIYTEQTRRHYPHAFSLLYKKRIDNFRFEIYIF